MLESTEYNSQSDRIGWFALAKHSEGARRCIDDREVKNLCGRCTYFPVKWVNFNHFTHAVLYHTFILIFIHKLEYINDLS